MVYIALSCCPSADVVIGRLDLQDTQESLPSIANAVWVLGSTLGYPVVLAITAIAELYLALDWSINKYKQWRLDKKITKLEQCSDEEIEKIKAQRLTKLEARGKKQDQDVLKVKEEVLARFPEETASSVTEKIYNSYFEAKKAEAEHKDEFDMSWCANRIVWETRIKVIQAGMRTHGEMKCLKSGADIRGVLCEKKRFSKLRREIRGHVDSHYLYDLLIAQIPVVGLLWESHSTYTTKSSLEKTLFEGAYNDELDVHPWLKPYGY